MAETPMQSIVDWREFRDFAAVDLSRSFILTWALESETVVIGMKSEGSSVWSCSMRSGQFSD